MSDALNKRIDSMTREEMARHWRFAPHGDAIFSSKAHADRFVKRFRSLGGMSPEISKRIGLERGNP